MGFFDWFKPSPPAPEPEQVATVPTREDIEAALVRAERMVLENNAPTPVLARVLRITTIAREILPRIDNLGMDSHDGYTVVATATEYLPESVASYIALPRDWADTRPVANGKSSLLLLVDQLDLLSLTMARMYDATNRMDAAGLVAQGAFLESKFGHRNTGKIRLDSTAAQSSNPLDI